MTLGLEASYGGRPLDCFQRNAGPSRKKNVDSGGGFLSGIAYSGSNNMPTKDQLMNIIENHQDAHTRQIIHHSNLAG